MTFIPTPINVTPGSKSFTFTPQAEQAGIKLSYLGTPVISNLEFPAGTYNDLNDVPIDFPALRFDTVVMSVTQEREIVKTKVAGYNGTIKQYISEGDFEIFVSGKINSLTIDNGFSTLDVNNPGNTIPEEEVRRIFQTLKVPVAITVTSDFLELFEISSVVIDAYTIQEIEGSVNEYEFTLKMSSDVPTELQ